MTQNRETLLTSGYTMLPVVWPGSVLKVTPFCGADAQVGDIICLASSIQPGKASRIVKIDESAAEREFHVRTDGAKRTDSYTEEAIIYTVLGVANKSISFSTSGLAGKAASRIALSNRPSAKAAQKGLRLANRLAKRVLTESPF